MAGSALFVVGRIIRKQERGTKRECMVCGEEYERRAFGLDDGSCPKCRPGFLDAPTWLRAGVRSTEALWSVVMALHCLLAFLAMFVDGAGIVILYCATVFLYFGVRVGLAELLGKQLPVLTKFQRVALLLLPVYGLPFFAAVACVASLVRQRL